MAYLGAGEILVGIANYMLEQGYRRFTHDNKEFQIFFHQQKSMHPELMKNIGFRECDFYPESENVSQAYSNLTCTGLLFSWGLDFNPHEFSPRCKNAFKKYVKPKISEEQEKELEAISMDFIKKFAVPSKGIERKVA